MRRARFAGTVEGQEAERDIATVREALWFDLRPHDNSDEQSLAGWRIAGLDHLVAAHHELGVSQRTGWWTGRRGCGPGGGAPPTDLGHAEHQDDQGDGPQPGPEQATGAPVAE